METKTKGKEFGPEDFFVEEDFQSLVIDAEFPGIEIFPTDKDEDLTWFND